MPVEVDCAWAQRAVGEGVTSRPRRRYEAGEPMADLLHIPPMPEGKTPWDMLASN